MKLKAIKEFLHADIANINKQAKLVTITITVLAGQKHALFQNPISLQLSICSMRKKPGIFPTVSNFD